MTGIFDIEKFKNCLDDFKDFPWLRENIIKVWENYDGQKVFFPYYRCGEVGCFQNEKDDRYRAQATCVLKEWCRDIKHERQ